MCKHLKDIRTEPSGKAFGKCEIKQDCFLMIKDTFEKQYKGRHCVNNEECPFLPLKACELCPLYEYKK